MRILGIDCGLKTGWCIIEKGRVQESGVEDFNPRRGSSNGTLFLEYRRWLSQIMLPINPIEGKKAFDLIVYEQSHMRGGAATELQMNMSGRVQEEATKAGIPFTGVHTGTLKKAVVGKGNASKKEVLTWAKKFLPRAPEDDNEADAAALAKYGELQYEQITNPPKPEPQAEEGPEKAPAKAKKSGDQFDLQRDLDDAKGGKDETAFI